jgi:hypothetical protein
MNKDIRQFNHKKQRHGYWEVYKFDDNYLFFKAFYHNNKISGYEEFYPYPTNKVEKRFHII